MQTAGRSLLPQTKISIAAAKRDPQGSEQLSGSYQISWRRGHDSSFFVDRPGQRLPSSVSKTMAGSRQPVRGRLRAAEFVFVGRGFKLAF